MRKLGGRARCEIVALARRRDPRPGRSEWTSPVAVTLEPRPPIAAASRSHGWLAVLLLSVALRAGTAARAAGIADAWAGTYWGEPSSALLAHFGARATALPRPIDFGDSYTRNGLRRVMVGGVPLIAFFQQDKKTGGLKRIQLERQRHGVSPPAFRAVLGALDADYGAPDALCEVAPGPASGYQAADERAWLRDRVIVRAIFRDTTIEAVEGCITGHPMPCGLTGQLSPHQPAGGRRHRLPRAAGRPR